MGSTKIIIKGSTEKEIDLSEFSEAVREEIKSKLRKKKFVPDDLTNGFIHSSNYNEILPADRYHENTRKTSFSVGDWRATLAGMERKVEYDKALQRIHQWKAENCEEWVCGKNRYFIDYSSNRFGVDSFLFSNSSNGNPIGYFTSRNDAQNCTTNCKDDLKTVFEYYK